MIIRTYRLGLNVPTKIIVCKPLERVPLKSCLSFRPKLKLNSMVLVRERTIPTEQPPLIGEVIANFLGMEVATWSA
jgi:hypothetical protein